MAAAAPVETEKVDDSSEKKGLKHRLRRFWKEWLKPLLVIGLVVGAVRSSLADWNDVPTGSMKPTILEGDRIFVNKMAYGLNFPFTRYQLASWDEPKRGEIVVFFCPADGVRMVKRVIGLPGDRIELRNNKLFVNGEAAEYSDLDKEFVEAIEEDERNQYLFASEALDEKSHPVMMTPLKAAPRWMDAFIVPEDGYFVMGDNRDNSYDSRFYGVVPRANVVGRTGRVAISFDLDNFLSPRWSRFFKPID